MPRADYLIIGAGPTGMSLAYTLAVNGKRVAVIEKYDKLGGSWNADFVNGKYFAENSPRVLADTGAHMDFLYEIGMTRDDFSTIYGNFLITLMKMVVFTLSYLDLFDLVLLLQGIVMYYFSKGQTRQTLAEWMSEKGVSERGKQGLTKLSILICDVPDRTNVSDFFCTIRPSGGSFVQMKRPNQWHRVLEDRFKKMSNVKMLTGCEVVEMNGSYDSHGKYYVDSATIRDNNTKTLKKIHSDRFVFCCQSDAICKILKESDRGCRNNWCSISWLTNWCRKTYYSSIGFQLHYKDKVEFPTEWNWSIRTDWSIIILPVSNWLNKPSKDPSIETVWSCCIIDFDSKSQRIDKTPNECDIREIIDESMHQLKKVHPTFRKPDAVSISPGLHKRNGRWQSYNTGFTRGSHINLPMKGDLCENLFALGCFTETTPEISHMGKAVDASEKYLDTYERNLTYRIQRQTAFEWARQLVVAFLLILFLVKK